MKELQWPLIEKRVDLKVLMITAKALHGVAPSYLIDGLEIYTPKRTLRSSDDKSITLVLGSPKKAIGQGTWNMISSRLWNHLPIAVMMRGMKLSERVKCTCEFIAECQAVV